MGRGLQQGRSRGADEPVRRGRPHVGNVGIEVAQRLDRHPPVLRPTPESVPGDPGVARGDESSRVRRRGRQLRVLHDAPGTARWPRQRDVRAVHHDLRLARREVADRRSPFVARHAVGRERGAQMNLPTLRFRSLQTRIVVVFLVLLLTVQLAGYAFIHNAIANNARRYARDELAVGERVFNRLLAQSNLRLTQTVQALAADFALREAVATRDRPAIAAILRRHPERSGADLTMVVGTDGRLLADLAAPRGGAVPDPVARYVARAARGERAPGVGIIREAPYQLVAAPIGQAAPVGWGGIGLRLDERGIKDLAGLRSEEHT